MGATASTLWGITSAIAAVEDLQWLPPSVTALHQWIAAGAGSAGLQPYLPPSGLVLLVQAAVNSKYNPLFGALAVLSWVCFLRVMGTATTRVAGIALPGCIQLWNSKTREEGYTTRPLPRYADEIRAC